MNRHSRLTITVLLALLAAGLCLLAACPTKARLPYQKGLTLFQAQNYGGALTEFEKSLQADPEQKLALYYKARCLYELERFDEALPDFEEFIARTEPERAVYSDERYDAEFYRDKCKLELDQEVPQNEEAIPPPRMGE